MVFIRFIFALLTAAYAVWNAIVPAKAVAYAYGFYHPSAMEMKYLPLMTSTPVWQWVLVLISSLIFIVAAWRLITQPRSAFGAFVLAAVIDGAAWGLAKINPVYNATFTADELKMDYYIWGAIVVTALVYFLFSRTRKKRITPTVLA